MSADSHGWREMRLGRKIVLALFFLLLVGQYLIYAVYEATFDPVDNPTLRAFNVSLLDYYTFAEMFFPNHIGWIFLYDVPLPLHLPVIGLLNLASAFGLYVLMVWRRWPAWLVIPGYLLGGFLLWFVAPLIFWGR